MADKKPAPVERIQDGPVHIALWENDTQNGKYLNATIELRFKQNEEWVTGRSYGMTDLLHLKEAITEARRRGMARIRSQAAAKNDNG
jgi:hypothetical protein